MKHFLLYITALMLTGPLAGQSAGQNLVTGPTDFVGFSNYPSSPYLVEAGPGSFYWISGSYFSDVFHPKLNGIVNDFANLFFLKYNENGEAVSSNFIRGTDYTLEALSSNGGLTLAGRAFTDLDASGTILNLNGAYNMEFIAKYDRNSEFVKLAKVWNLGLSQSMYSQAKGDKRDGSMYIFGMGYSPAEVQGYGIIGELQTPSYLYVIKYDPDLQLEWVYTAGFDAAVTQDGSFYNLKVTPDIQGNAVITGSYASDCSPLFGTDALAPHPDGYGLFAVKLDKTGKQVWVKEGSMKGFGYETEIFKGLALRDGDLVMAGVTTTGYFKLGDVEVNFVNGSGSTNQFLFRMGPDGAIRWLTPFQNRGEIYGEGKKGTGDAHGANGIQSDEFSDDIYYDVISWKDKVCYMCGSFLNDAFDVAGRILRKTYPAGAFVVAVDLENGEALWGYGLSSDYVYFNGFDADASGNVTLMGYSSSNQDFEGLAADPVQGTYPLFYVGLDFKGNPLWTNGAYILKGPGYQLKGIDLEVLSGGDVFSSVSLYQNDNLMVGGSDLNVNFPYANWLYRLEASSELGGLVSDASGNPVYPGYVKAFKSSRSGAYPMVDSVRIRLDGTYRFNGLYPGQYTLQAVPDRVAYPEALPTYLGNQVDWNNVQLNGFGVDDRASFLNIVLNEIPKFTPGDGSGTMTGFVGYEEDGVLKGTMARPLKKASALVATKPKEKKSVLSGEIVAFAETDDFGMFQFENVPDGDYELLIDIPGLAMLEIHQVTIQGNQIISGLDYTVGEDGIYTWTGVGILEKEPGMLNTFPNPGSGFLFMDLPSAGNYTIKVYSTDGRTILSEAFYGPAGIRTMDISMEKEGIYLIQIEGPDTSTAIKYLKK